MVGAYLDFSVIRYATRNTPHPAKGTFQNLRVDRASEVVESDKRSSGNQCRAYGLVERPDTILTTIYDIRGLTIYSADKLVTIGFPALAFIRFRDVKSENRTRACART